MFANFAKIGRAAGASPIWKNFQTPRVLLIPDCTSNIGLNVHHHYYYGRTVARLDNYTTWFSPKA